MKPVTQIDAATAYRHHEPGASRVAAFFDIDGTLLPRPSLERRFVGELRDEGVIPTGNYLRWLGTAIGLAPRGVLRSIHGNKVYLRNVPVCVLSFRQITFFSNAIRRVAWHASQGHSVILVSGTLDFLAQQAALALTLRLALRGVTAKIGVCATRAERLDGRYTGRIIGAANFAEEKMIAVRRIARESGFNLARCYAYSDSANDRWMLGAVGKPAAVNPSKELRRIATLRYWPIFDWTSQDAIEDTTRLITTNAEYDRPLFPGIPSENA
ncbi:MAG TPA: HAD family phosphatase [Candidatus Sulfotelmatobacter sp.]|nr:HAD family phosphatase [Candidatus Sulfotelmatobacter sp.]